MHFYPTTLEINESRSNASMTDLSSDPSDLTQEHLYVSGSRWGQRHLKALRAQLISPVSPDRIFLSLFLFFYFSPSFSRRLTIRVCRVVFVTSSIMLLIMLVVFKELRIEIRKYSLIPLLI